MDPLLPDHMEALRQEVRRFADKEVRPGAAERDATRAFPWEIQKGLAEMGLMGILFPESLGGAGLGYLEYAVIIEELARVDGSVGLMVAAHNSLCANHIYAMGTDAQKARWLVPLAKGEALGAWALTEPDAGSDAGALRTTARREGDHWILNGTKTFITHGREGHLTVVMARTREGRGADGISAFVVERGTPGFRPGKQEDKLGMRASDTSELILEDVRVGPDHLLGTEGVGFRQAMKTLDGGRISIAALALGLAQGALEASLKHARTRRTFGKAIGEHQAIAFKLADMATQIEASRQLVHRAARLKDAGAPYGQAASMAKLYASETACRVADEAIQIHGGYGYLKDFPVERIYRDVKLCTLGEGTSEIQRLVIARGLMERE